MVKTLKYDLIICEKDLIIIRAIDPKYYSDFDPLKDGDLYIERLFKEI